MPVALSAALGPALAAAEPGDCLVLEDGDYAFPVITKVATAEAPLVIRAKNRGQARVSTGSLVVQGSSYVVIEGLLFVSAGNIQFTESPGCRLTRCRIHPMEKPDLDWVVVEGAMSHHIRIDHNDFGPKRIVSNMIMLEGDLPAKLQVVQYISIDHNV